MCIVSEKLLDDCLHGLVVCLVGQMFLHEVGKQDKSAVELSPCLAVYYCNRCRVPVPGSRRLPVGYLDCKRSSNLQVIFALPDSNADGACVTLSAALSDVITCFCHFLMVI